MDKEAKNIVPEELASVLTHFVVSLYFRIQEHPPKNFHVKLSSHGFHVLHILVRSETGEVPMTELVRRIGRTRQQLSRLISDLEDSGLVTRVHSRENRRSVSVAITEEGRRQTEAAFASVSEELSSYLSRLPEERLLMIQDTASQLGNLADQLEMLFDQKEEL